MEMSGRQHIPLGMVSNAPLLVASCRMARQGLETKLNKRRRKKAEKNTYHPAV
jgi:hypothetical protein